MYYEVETQIDSGQPYKTITHGLFKEPNKIHYSGRHAEVSELHVSNLGATTFRVNTTKGAVSGNRAINVIAKT